MNIKCQCAVDRQVHKEEQTASLSAFSVVTLNLRSGKMIGFGYVVVEEEEEEEKHTIEDSIIMGHTIYTKTMIQKLLFLIYTDEP